MMPWLIAHLTVAFTVYPTANPCVRDYPETNPLIIILLGLILSVVARGPHGLHDVSMMFFPSLVHSYWICLNILRQPENCGDLEDLWWRRGDIPLWDVMGESFISIENLGYIAIPQTMAISRHQPDSTGGFWHWSICPSRFHGFSMEILHVFFHRFLPYFQGKNSPVDSKSGPRSPRWRLRADSWRGAPWLPWSGSCEILGSSHESLVKPNEVPKNRGLLRNDNHGGIVICKYGY